MFKLITVQCQSCGTLSEAFVNTSNGEFELYPNCACQPAYHDEITTAPHIITTGNEGTARAGRGAGQWQKNR